MKKILSVISFILILLLPGTGMASERNLPFSPGEKMTFRIRWAFVIAGQVTLEFLPFEEFEGVEACRFRYTARTSRFVDRFYKVRDIIESYTDRNMTQSLLYTKSQRGRSGREIKVTFDWDENLAQYSDGTPHDPIEIMPNTFDPFSVFYALRILFADEDEAEGINITDGKRFITGTASVAGRERIRVAGTEYDTIVVEPHMQEIDGVFDKSEEASLQIWVTDDEFRIPVRIRSSIAVGSFVAELISYESGLKPLIIEDDSPQYD